ncbi:MAG: glycosyltransferase [Nitrospirae bacterium]|nr:glycosyltransferase [Nitrospirota bacterium]
MEKIAVVIPVKNEEEGLKELIASLARQLPQNGEIIFTDAGSTDDTVGIIERAGALDGRIKLCVSPGAFPGKGRNVAVSHTDADIIAQVDGGNMPADDWLEKVCEPILSGKADYVGGNFKIMSVRKKIFGMDFDMGDVYGASLFRTIDNEERIAGGFSVAYRRRVWEKVGGFPEWTPVAEDVLFVNKALINGARAVFAKDAFVYWQIGPKFSDIVKRQTGYQRDKFLHTGKMFDTGGSTFFPVALLGMIMLFPFAPFMQVLTILIILAQWFRQSLKTLRVYRKRTAEKGVQPPLLLSVPPIMLIELLTIYSRMYGSIKGILALGRKKEFEASAKNYLYDGGSLKDNGLRG